MRKRKKTPRNLPSSQSAENSEGTDGHLTASALLQKFRRDWLELTEIDVALDELRQKEELIRGLGENLSEKYNDMLNDMQLENETFKRDSLNRLFLGMSRIGALSKTGYEIVTLLLASMVRLVPEMKTARLAQAVLLAAGRLFVQAPSWAVRNIDEVMEAVKNGGSLDPIFGLTASKGKTSDMEALVRQERDTELVMAVQWLRERFNMSLENACDHIANETGMIAPKTLENIYSKYKKAGWFTIVPTTLTFLFPHEKNKIQLAWREYIYRFDQQTRLHITPPQTRTTSRIGRKCLKCDASFAAPDRVTRLCPTCQQQ